jgi:two-component system cell cycle response regulator DivK
MNKTVLIIEDNPKNMKLFKDILQANGYTTIETVDAKKGIELAGALNPALILMDIMLPEINGFEAVRILKADAKTKAIPVIALTSFAMAGDKEKAFEAGFDGYITKPINVREFVKEIAKIMALSSYQNC